MRRDVGLNPGPIILILVGLLDTTLVGLLLCGVSFGAARGLQTLWNAAFASIDGVPTVGVRLTAALLLPFLLWAAIRPAELLRKPGPVDG